MIRLREQGLRFTKPKWHSLLCYTQLSVLGPLTFTLGLGFLISNMVERRLKVLGMEWPHAVFGTNSNMSNGMSLVIEG